MFGKAIGVVMANLIANDYDINNIGGFGYKNAKPHKTPNGKQPSGVAAAKRLATKRNNIRKHG